MFPHRQWLNPLSWWLSQPPLCSLLQGLLRRVACLTLQLGPSCLSPWRLCTRLCTNWKCSMSSACCWWGVSETRWAFPPHLRKGVGSQCYLGVCGMLCTPLGCPQNGSLAQQALGLISFSLRKPVWFQSLQSFLCTLLCAAFLGKALEPCRTDGLAMLADLNMKNKWLVTGRMTALLMHWWSCQPDGG